VDDASLHEIFQTVVDRNRSPFGITRATKMHKVVLPTLLSLGGATICGRTIVC